MFYYEVMRLKLAKNMKTRAKTLMIALVPSVLTVGVSFNTWANLNHMSDSTHWVNHTHEVLESAHLATGSALEMEAGLRGYLLAGQEAFWGPYEAGEAVAFAELDRLKEKVSDNPEQVARIQEAEALLRAWQAEVVAPALALRRDVGIGSTLEDVSKFVQAGRGKAYFDDLTLIMHAFSEAETALLDQRSAQYVATSKATLATMFWATLAAVLIGGLVAFWIGGGIARGVQSVSRAMKKLADGDTDVVINGLKRGDEVGDMARALDVFRNSLKTVQQEERAKAAQKAQRQTDVVHRLRNGLSALAHGDLKSTIADAFPQEYEQLRQDFNLAVQNLDAAIDQVAKAADRIGVGSTEIASSSGDLAKRTESQAATLEETVAALDELNSSVAGAARSAQSVEEKIGFARKEAERSGQIVQSTIDAMTEIEASSSQIAQIVSVIDDIAFQTNLLALNAGVEAARAGDAGRGFAVVASEVRALAQRSAESATEIKELIAESSKQVFGGVELVNRAGTSLTDIAERVKEVSGLVSDMAAGASEQSRSLNEISEGAAQLDQVTQQNAVMVEEATAASALLRKDAQAMKDLMAQFQTVAGDRAETRAAQMTDARAA